MFIFFRNNIQTLKQHNRASKPAITMPTFKKLSLFITIMFLKNVYSYSGADMNVLMTTLLDTNYYNPDVRPREDYDDPTYLFISVHLVAINSVDVVSQKLTTTAYLTLAWHDDYLTWDPTAHNDIDLIYLPQEKIWLPDLSLQNGFSKIKELGDDFLLTYIEHTGLVIWKPFEVFETKCKIDIKYFPFDKQNCTIEFGAWMLELDDIDVNVDGAVGLNLDEYIESDEWVLESTNAWKTEAIAGGARVHFSMVLKRIPNHYIANILVPVLFLSVLINLTFAIPADSGEKLGYAMTVFLSFAVFLTIVSGSFPVTSSTSVISGYLMFLITVGTTIVIITGLQLRLHHRDPERQVPEICCKIVRLCLILQCRTSYRRKQSISPEPNVTQVTLEDFEDCNPNTKKLADDSIRTNDNSDERSDITWSDLVKAIDFFCFFIFMILIWTVTVLVITLLSSAQ